MNRLKIEVPEFLFVIYFWSFALLRPLLQIYSNYSSYILLLSSVILLLIQIYYNHKNKINQLDKAIYLILVLLIFFLADALLRGGEKSFQYLYEFIYRGVIPVVFLSKVRSSYKLLLYFAYLSASTFCLYIIDPINEYAVFGDYMTFGFSLTLPAFIGIFLGYHYFKIRWLLLIEFICFIEIVIFANRGVLLSILLFILLYIINYVNFKSTFNKLITIITLIFSYVIYNNLNFILENTNNLLENAGYRSYSLAKITSFLGGGNNEDLYSGRLDLWNNGLSMIKDKPLIGHGTSYFYEKYNIYSHNIFLDILVFYGYIGLIITALFCFYSLNKIFKTKNNFKLLGLVFFCLWFPKLFLSTYFFQETSFWCFMIFPIIVYNLKFHYYYSKI